MNAPARLRTAILCLALLLASGLLSACAFNITVHYRGVAPLNLNEEGESLPVKLRIYQFLDETTAKLFVTEPFDAVWTDDKGTLGDGLLMMKETDAVIPQGANDPFVTVQLLEEKEETDKRCRYVGIMALIGTANDENKPRRDYKPVSEVGNYIFNITGYWIEVVKK